MCLFKMKFGIRYFQKKIINEYEIYNKINITLSTLVIVYMCIKCINQLFRYYILRHCIKMIKNL